MGILDRIKRGFTASAAVPERRNSLENPSVSLYDAGAWDQIFGAWHSVSGVEVTVEKAMGVPAVWAAVNFISSTVASLPLDLYSRDGESRIADTSAQLYGILHDAVNEETSSFQWRKRLMMSVLLKGRSFTFIERNLAGRITNLWLLDPTKMVVERKSGKIRYRYRDGGPEKVYDASEIIDIIWAPGFDGLTHFDPIERLKNAVGLSIAMEEYASKFFQNGGVPPLQLVGPMASPAAVERASSDMSDAVAAGNKKGRLVLAMPLAHELKQIGFDPAKGQMTEARRFQLEELARIFQLPPTFLQDLTHGTFSNTEQQDLHFVKHTLTQWLECIEQELNLKLFSARNRRQYVEFNVDGLLRGDFKTRMEGYGQAIQNGINTPNEVRAMENWPKKGAEADKLYVQGATVPLGTQPAPAAPSQPGDAPEEDDNDQTA